MKTNWLDYSHAVVLARQDAQGVEQKAIQVLLEEIEKRTGIRLPVSHQRPQGALTITVGEVGHQELLPAELASLLEELDVPGAEGFRAAVSPSGAAVAGTDSRGLLYGIGLLLRKMRWGRGELYFPDGLSVSRTPEFPIRGHQLGYRPKTNAYDAWTPEIYDQYIRELALFGANGIELLPPRTDDHPTSVHMKWDSLDMMRRLSGFVPSYGMEVWAWYPNMADEYDSDESVKAELMERDAVFSAVPFIDHVFIPGGDPGNLPPKKLFDWSSRVAELLRRHHPRAKLWLSPQTFTPNRPWVDAFYQELQKEPEWLSGVCFAPWEKDSAAELRRQTPARYPIRNYADITHVYRCQYPVPKLDLPLALTLGRECVNPRPRDEKLIHNTYKEHFDGSICYSEGINDDVNKFIWLDQEFDSSFDVAETLRDYARLFIDFEMADDIAQGLFALEENLRGPVSENDGIDACLSQWQAMEKRVKGYARNNYRFEMGLIRACFDAYQKRRYLYEAGLEREAVAMLGRYGELGADLCLDNARTILEKARTQPICRELHSRIMELSDLLFDHIGYQLTVGRHGAEHWERGAFVECIDKPLNDYRYLMKEIRRIRSLKNPLDVLASVNITYAADKEHVMFDDDNACRCEAIHLLLTRTDPGPGGFYDNMGSWSSFKRVRNHDMYQQDPAFLHSALRSFCLQSPHDEQDAHNVPLAWQLLAAAMYTTPLEVFYENLDPQAEYLIRVTYAGYFAEHIKLTAAGGSCVIHDLLTIERQFVTVEFSLPRESYSTGRLDLAFTALDGERGSGVAEIWIIKKPVQFH